MVFLIESKADIQKLIDFVGDNYADLFLKLKPRIKSPQNDIYFWLKKNPDELKYFLDNLNSTKSKSQEKKQAKVDGAELIKETDNWLVYKITTYEASKYYGKNTKWCISGNYPNEKNRGQYWFDDYTSRGIKFYFYINKNDPVDKYAIAIYNNGKSEKYNAKDDMVDILPDSVPEIDGVYTKPEEFEIKNGVLIKYNGPGGDVIIPNDVIAIGERVFDNCIDLISITIPDSVNHIGYRAFNGCTSLTSIKIPDSVTIIDDQAFSFCKKLTSITIPDSVTNIGNYAFEGCTRLTSITIPGSITSIGLHAFQYCTGLKNITIPDSVTSIGDWAFEGCKRLTSIIIPDSVNYMGENAFSECTKLTSVSIGNSIIIINKWAFEGCKRLTSITISDSVISIDDWSFSNCISLKTVYYNGTKNDWNNIKIYRGNEPLLNAIIHCKDGIINGD